MKVWGICLAALLVSGCAATGENENVKDRPFSMEQIAKSDVDMVAELAVDGILGELRRLMHKLYLRNPRELNRGGYEKAEDVEKLLFEQPPEGERLVKAEGPEAIRQALREDYEGDRVLSFISGLRDMTLDAYGGRTRFYITDELDPQKLYNCARNYEVAAWLLRSSRDEQERFLLLSHAAQEGESVNLSFERLFGKIIAKQDLMAQVIADSSNRQIKTVVQTVARYVFLPI